MGIKLWVDDIRPAPKGWHLARTVTEAIRILSGPMDVEAVSLDHDISHQYHFHQDVTCTDPSHTENHKPHNHNTSLSLLCGETYEPVARFIALQYMYLKMRESFVKAPKIYIHTANPEGAKTMQKILEEAGLKPIIK